MLRKKIISLLAFAISIGLTYLLAFLINHYFGIEKYGEFTIYFTSNKLLSIVILFGQDLFLIRNENYGDSIDKNQGSLKYFDNYLSWVISILTLLSVIIVVALTLFGALYVELTLQILLSLLPAAIMRGINAHHKASLQLFKFVFFEYLIVPFCAILLLTLQQYLIVDIYEFSVIEIHIVALFVGAILIITQNRLWVVKLRLSFDIFETKMQLKASLPFIFTTSAIYLNIYLDQYFVMFFFGLEKLGIYELMYKIAQVTSLPLIAFNNVSAPAISQYYNNNNVSDLKKYLTKTTLLGICISLPLTIIIFFFPTFFLKMLSLNVNHDERILFAILLIAQSINYIVGPIGLLFQMTREQNTFIVFVICSIVTNIVSNIILIPIYGLMGVGISSCISMFILNILPFFYFKYKYGYTTVNIT
jgi:O-antigen/teichoic acid export membrane protein